MRRIVGALLIGIALLGGLAVSTVARVGLIGMPAVASAPAPPSIGDCVLRSAGAVRVVPCTELHTAEVTAAFPAQPTPAASRPGAARSPSRYQLCQQAASSYVGEAGIPGFAGWQLPILPTIVQLGSGPAPMVIPGWSWLVCLIAPTTPLAQLTGYTGRITDRSTGATPAALRSCYSLVSLGQATSVQDGVSSTFSSGVSCLGDHAGEIMATRTLKLTAPVATTADGRSPVDTLDTDAGRLAQCLVLAQQRTGLADPTFGGRLSVVIRLVVGGTSSSGTATVTLTSVSYAATCAVQAPTGRQLYQSLVGLVSDTPPLR